MVSDKYKLPVDINIVMAKRLLVDSIYEQANLEGITCTFADTAEIIENIRCPENLRPKDVSKICYLRDAWKYLFDHLDDDNLIFIEEMHSIYARADVAYQHLGRFRVDSVRVSGSKFVPEIPSPDSIEKLGRLLVLDENGCVTDQALNMGLYLMRMQPFLDGNKRAGVFLINKILISHGLGMFSVPVDENVKFKAKLVSYYESNDNSELKEWSWNNCLQASDQYLLHRSSVHSDVVGINSGLKR